MIHLLCCFLFFVLLLEVLSISPSDEGFFMFSYLVLGFQENFGTNKVYATTNFLRRLKSLKVNTKKKPYKRAVIVDVSELMCFYRCV